MQGKIFEISTRNRRPAALKEKDDSFLHFPNQEVINYSKYSNRLM